jgi:hypothetical protein
MFNMLDDGSRLFTGSKLYARQTLPAYFASEPIADLEIAPHVTDLRTIATRTKPIANAR